MTNREKMAKLKKLVEKKMANGSATVTYNGKNGTGVYNCNDFVFSSAADGWTLYQGCELIIGDATLQTCISIMLDICGEWKK